jgi:CRP-like cAMP-binding protein
MTLLDKETGRHMYIVKSGEVQIVDSNSNHVLETVRSGGILGEMALVDGGPRSSTARSFGRSIVIPIDEHRFLFLVQHTPFFAIRVMRAMSARLRSTNERAMILPGQLLARHCLVINRSSVCPDRQRLDRRRRSAEGGLEIRIRGFRQHWHILPTFILGGPALRRACEQWEHADRDSLLAQANCQHHSGRLPS